MNSTIGRLGEGSHWDLGPLKVQNFGMKLVDHPISHNFFIEVQSFSYQKKKKKKSTIILMFFPTHHFAQYGFIWMSFGICVLFCFENKFCEAMNNCVDINHRIEGV